MELYPHYNALLVNPEIRILGIRLLPLSLGHARLLAALGLDDPRDLATLLAALRVCSLPASSLNAQLSTLNSPFFALRRFWLALLIRWASGPAEVGPQLVLTRALEQWQAYLDHYHTAPAVGPAGDAQPGARTITCATPRLAHVEHVLTAICGLSPAAALDLPLHDALWRYAVAREYAGTGLLQEHPELDDTDYDVAQSEADRLHDHWLSLANSALRN